MLLESRFQSSSTLHVSFFLFRLAWEGGRIQVFAVKAKSDQPVNWTLKPHISLGHKIGIIRCYS
jgi:hypothetical protein